MISVDGVTLLPLLLVLALLGLATSATTAALHAMDPTNLIVSHVSLDSFRCFKQDKVVSAGLVVLSSLLNKLC